MVQRSSTVDQGSMSDHPTHRRVSVQSKYKFSKYFYEEKTRGLLPAFQWWWIFTYYLPSNSQEKEVCGSRGLLVWIMLYKYAPLPVWSFICKRFMSVLTWKDDILVSYARLFRNAIRFDFILIYYNTCPYRAHLVNQFLESEDICLMDWEARSLHLNQVQHIWDAMMRKIWVRFPPLRTTQDLKRVLLVEWD